MQRDLLGAKSESYQYSHLVRRKATGHVRLRWKKLRGRHRLSETAVVTMLKRAALGEVADPPVGPGARRIPPGLAPDEAAAQPVKEEEEEEEEDAAFVGGLAFGSDSDSDSSAEEADQAAGGADASAAPQPPAAEPPSPLLDCVYQPDNSIVFATFESPELAQVVLDCLVDRQLPGCRCSSIVTGDHVVAAPAGADILAAICDMIDPLSADQVALGLLPGMQLVPEFLSAEEEASLASFLDGPDGQWDSTLARKVAHFGRAFDYITRRAEDASVQEQASQQTRRGAQPESGAGAEGVSLPAPLASAAARIQAAAGEEQPFDQITANEYFPGQGISPHIDTRADFGGTIGILSLLSDIVMDLKHEDDSRAEADALEEPGERPRRAFLLPRRSLLLLQGESRYRWKHAITGRKSDKVGGQMVERKRRVSVTMRRVLPPDQRLAEYADNDPDAPPKRFHSPRLVARLEQHRPAYDRLGAAESVAASGGRVSGRTGPAAVAVDAGGASGAAVAAAAAGGAGAGAGAADAEAPALEKRHVHAVYDAIATHFSDTRHSPWPGVVEYLEGLAPGTLVADVGCGNGKYMGCNKATAVVGLDMCAGLAEIAAQRGHEASVGDALHTALGSGRFDVAISIAVFHHLSSAQRRQQAMSELLRVVRPGGQVLLQAWAKEQAATSRRQFHEPDTMVPWKLQRKYVETLGEEDRQALQEAGGEIDPKSGAVVFQRYCHVYTRGELPALATAVGGCRLLWERWERGNWVVLLQKDD